MNNTVCAGIVLYHPEEQRFLSVLGAVMPQVRDIVIINNGSEKDLTVLKDINAQGRITVIQNSRNEGVAAAFNQILSFAKKEGYEWVILLDQDSVLSRGAVEKMLRLTKAEYAGLICPVVYDEKRRKRLTPRGGMIVRSALTVISSGSLISVSAALSVGGFREELFVDMVDFDFNERLIRAGYRLLRCRNAAIFHELGDSAHSRAARSHSAQRLYYMSRNAEDFLHRYRQKNAAAKLQLFVAKTATKLRIILSENDKKAKLAAIRQGRRDHRKMRFEELLRRHEADNSE